MKPRFKLAAITTCTTYNFRVIKDHGWAACTVDDNTSALMITSDWGNWSHTWGHKSFGDSQDLTEFIVKAGPDYLANKLMGGPRNYQEFDAAATLRVLKTELLKLRNSYDISEEIYKECRDKLHDLRQFGHGGSEESFANHVAESMVNEKDECIFGEPWDYYQYKETNEYKILLRSIIPALKLACKKTTAQRKKMLAGAPPVSSAPPVEQQANG